MGSIRGTLVLAALSLVLNLAACSEADGGTRGGEPLLDAAPPPEDSGSPPSLCVPASARGTGSTFADLYQDYFGRIGSAGCAGDGQCHGAADHMGATSSHFVCPAENKDACYQGLQTAALVTAADKDAPEQSKLYEVLRKSQGGGSMPLRPVCTFDETDMKRIADWLRIGAPNN